MNFTIWRKLWPQKRNHTKQAVCMRDRTRFRPWILELEDRFAPSVTTGAEILPTLPASPAPQAVVQVSDHTAGPQQNVGQQVSDQAKILQTERLQNGQSQGLGNQLSNFVVDVVVTGNANAGVNADQNQGQQVSAYVQILHQQRDNGEFEGGLGVRIVIFINTLTIDSSGSTDQTSSGNGSTSISVPTTNTTSIGEQVSTTVQQQQHTVGRSDSGVGAQVVAFVRGTVSDNSGSDSVGTSRVLTVSFDTSARAVSVPGQQVSDYARSFQVDASTPLGQNVRTFVQSLPSSSDQDDKDKPDQDLPAVDRPDNMGAQVSEHIQGLLTVGYQNLGQDLRSFVQALPDHPLSATAYAPATLEEPGVTSPVLGAAVDTTEQGASVDEPISDGLIENLLTSSFAVAGLLWQLKVSEEHKRPRKDGEPKQ